MLKVKDWIVKKGKKKKRLLFHNKEMESCVGWSVPSPMPESGGFTSLFLDVNSVGRNHSDSNLHNRPSLRGHCVRCHEVALEKPKGQGRQSKVTSK